MSDILHVLRLSVCALMATLVATACGEAPEPDHSPYAGGPAHHHDTLTATLCAALDGDLAAQLPDDTAFAARGVDGRVHVAWAYRSAAENRMFQPLQQTVEDRLAFDLAVGDFQTHNMEPESPNRGLTGAARKQDGGLCILQTEAAAIEPLIEAVHDFETALNAQ